MAQVSTNIVVKGGGKSSKMCWSAVKKTNGDGILRDKPTELAGNSSDHNLLLTFSNDY